MEQAHLDLALEFFQKMKGLAPHEQKALQNRAQNVLLFNEEHCKAHPMETVNLAPEQIEAYCAHMLDGGGVTDSNTAINDGRSLFLLYMQALHDRDWCAIRHLERHIVKAYLKSNGHVIVGADGRVKQMSGAKSGTAPPIPPPVKQEQS
jgi:hypothetical protein